MNIQFLYKSVMRGHSLLRTYQNYFLKDISISGEVIDLGAKSLTAKYYSYIRTMPDARITFVDYFSKGPSIVSFDLEKRFDLPSEKYDFVLAINVMEHIYNYENFVSEIARILRNGKGVAHVMVPFIWEYHPDPHDFFRFTIESLQRIMDSQGLKVLSIAPTGEGRFHVAAHMIFEPVPINLLRFIGYLVFITLDRISRLFMRTNGFPLGFHVVVKKI
jgi:SAM-dependent methyltransferase